jgi:hypothetical protein
MVQGDENRAWFGAHAEGLIDDQIEERDSTMASAEKKDQPMRGRRSMFSMVKSSGNQAHARANMPITLAQ